MDRREALVLLRSPRWRYLIDIIVLVAVTFILHAVLGALVHEPISWDTGFVLDAIGKIVLVAVHYALVFLRGQRQADIGFKKPQHWTPTFTMNVGLASIVFVGMYVKENARY